jgi:ADP-ribosylglycohydrolase
MYRVARSLDLSRPLNRALCSLQGLAVGDGFGAGYFTQPAQASQSIAARTLIDAPWTWTDDTNMALSIVESLHRHGCVDQDWLAESFARRYDFYRGYGMAMHGLLARIRDGAAWREEAGALFGGAGSFGNGAAMRVAPLGGYFAPDLAMVVDQARLAAEITHAHPEGVAGAIAVAVAAALAWQHRLPEQGTPVDPATFMGEVLQWVPESAVREGLALAGEIERETPIVEVVRALGNGSEVTAQDTVPFAIWCAAQHLDSFEDALWCAVSGLGDIDTTGAMVGGIVALHTGVVGIPAAWLDRCEGLPAWPFERSVQS